MQKKTKRKGKGYEVDTAGGEGVLTEQNRCNMRNASEIRSTGRGGRKIQKFPKDSFQQTRLPFVGSPSADPYSPSKGKKTAGSLNSFRPPEKGNRIPNGSCKTTYLEGMR